MSTRNITQLSAATPVSGDEVCFYDASGSSPNLTAKATIDVMFAAMFAIGPGEAVNLPLGTSTGTKIGTGATQKLGFYNATPVVQPAGTVDVLASLVTLGLRAASSNPPLNIGTGAITCGAIGGTALTVTSIVGTGAVALTGDMTISDATNIVLNATTGTKIGTATTQKLGFYNATPIVRPSAYTQTYATASRTHSNPTAVTLTDNTAGTPATTLTALSSGTVYATDVASLRNNLASLAQSNNQLIADLANLKQLVNSLVDDSQALGFSA